MKKIDAYFNDYGSYHPTNANKICHVFGIGLIVVSLLGLLDQIEFFDWQMSVKGSAALVLFLASNIFYIMLDIKVGLAMIAATSIAYFVGTQFSLTVLWSLFAAGWIFQGIGHYVFEKKSPAFTKNLVHLFIGPAYLLHYYLLTKPSSRVAP